MNKSFFTSLMLVGAAAGAQTPPDFETKTSVVKDATTQMEIALNAQTVICSHLDYGYPALKILIPQLGALTVMNHRNSGAGAPCVAAGICVTGNLPSDIIDALNPTEKVAAHVTLTKVYEIDNKASVCRVTLLENLEIPIRGKTFLHQRQLEVGERSVEDCQ